MRTIASSASTQELVNDLAYLHKTWETIARCAVEHPSPALIFKDLSLAQRVLRDFVTDTTNKVFIDCLKTFEALQDFGRNYMPSLVDKLVCHTGERALFDMYGVEAEIERGLARRVDLKSGGYLIIDQTEAMTTIDVNTGAYVGSRNLEETLFKTNLEATHAIARQLRLRNLGGIIIVDFIDMEVQVHRETVLAEFKKALSSDRVPIQVHDFSPLGLVEMTRKRTRESLTQLLCEPCTVCVSKGQIKTARTICYEIMREIQREACQFNPKEFRLIASQNVIDLFLEEESQHLAQLCDLIGKPVALQVETNSGQEQYDIVLIER